MKQSIDPTGKEITNDGKMIFNISTKVMKDEDGEIIWTDKKNLMAKSQGYIKDVTIVVETETEGLVQYIQLTESMINKIVKRKQEVEQITLEEFWD